MVTFTKIYRTATEKWFVVGDCFSNDEKPVFDICQGSVLKEHDTGKKYKFDEENTLWVEVSADEPIEELPRFEDTIFDLSFAPNPDRVSIPKDVYNLILLNGYVDMMVYINNFVWDSSEASRPYLDPQVYMLAIVTIIEHNGESLSTILGRELNDSAASTMTTFIQNYLQGLTVFDIDDPVSFPINIIIPIFGLLLAILLSVQDLDPEPETQWNYAVPKVVADGHSSYAEYTPPDELLYTMMPLGSDRSPAEAFVYTELSMEDDHVIANYTFEGWYAGNDDYFPDEEEFTIMSVEWSSWTKVDPDNYDGAFGNVLVARYSQGG